MNKSMLVSMAGPENLRLNDLSDFEAGYIVLMELASRSPGMTWGDLAAMARPGSQENLSGWLTDLQKGIMSPLKQVGSVVGDVFREGGSWVGNGLRLFTSKEVIGGLNSAYTSFTDGGGVAGFWGGKDMFGMTDIFNGDKSTDGGGGFMEWIGGLVSGVGAKAKANEAGIMGLPAGALPWVAAAGLGLVLLFGKRAPARRR